ncbi:MAG: protease modulator HflC [Gammaproteobacteria bacterium]|nr:protease modulator HflC [Gammaproteobacteria bacterium]
MNRPLALVILIAVIGLITFSATFTVKETEKTIKLTLGEISRSNYEPGLYFKVPFYNTILKFDSRVLTLDARPERVLTAEKKNVVVDSFVKWRIEDVEKFFRATGGDERRALTLLSQFIKKGMLDEFGRRTIQEAISGERTLITREVKEKAGLQTVQLGIQLIDVRVKKVDLPPDVSDAVYRRMEKERATVAKAFRSRGQEQARGIRADADRQREEVIAEAYSEAEQIRGEGDAEAAEIYAKAFGKNPEFYSFTRSLNAYRSSFGSKQDVILLKPDSQFFKYFSDPLGQTK